MYYALKLELFSFRRSYRPSTGRCGRVSPLRRQDNGAAGGEGENSPEQPFSAIFRKEMAGDAPPPDPGSRNQLEMNPSSF